MHGLAEHRDQPRGNRCRALDVVIGQHDHELVASDAASDRLGMQRAPDAIRAIIRTSVISWFVVDSLASVAAGGALNVVANAAFLALFLVPLRLGARQESALAQG